MTCDICGQDWEATRPRKGKDGKYRCPGCANKARIRRYQATSKGKEALQRGRENSREANVLRTAKWKRENPEKARAQEIRYSKTAGGRKVANKKSKKHYWTDPEYYRLRAQARYYGEEVGIVKELFDRQPECQFCGASKGLTVDHIWPTSKGGKTIEGNIQTLCMPCNSFKRDRIFLADNKGMILND